MSRFRFRMPAQLRHTSPGDDTLQLEGLARGDLDKVVELIGSSSLSEDAIEREVLALVGDAQIARRAIDWIPEAFALVVVGHMAKVELPTTFSAKGRDGVWRQFPLSAEPIFAQAIHKAAETFHHGPRDLFGSVAQRSGILGAVNKALNAGQDINGATLSGLVLIGIPAETYALPRSWWQRVWSGRG